MPEPTVTPSRYDVTVLPADYPDAWLWTVTVALHHTGRHWIVYDRDHSYDTDGQRQPMDDFPPHASVEAALAVARRVAPNATFNGQPVPVGLPAA